MIKLEATGDGVLLAIRAQPGGRRCEIRPPVDGALKVVVTQVAEKGKANRAVLDFLAKMLGVRKSQLELVAGDTSRNKTVLVRDVTLAGLRARVEKLVEGMSEA